jgi:hypothetical protein
MKTVEVIEQYQKVLIDDGSIVVVPDDAVDVVEVGGTGNGGIVDLATGVSGVLAEENGGLGGSNFDESMANLFGAFGDDFVNDSAQCFFLVLDAGIFHLLTVDNLAGSFLQNVSALTPSIARTADWTLVTGFGYVEFDCTGGNLTLFLPMPTAGFYGRDVVVKKTNTANTLTIDAATAGSTLDGAGNATLSTRWSCLVIRGYSTGWRIVSRYL